MLPGRYCFWQKAVLCTLYTWLFTSVIRFSVYMTRTFLVRNNMDFLKTEFKSIQISNQNRLCSQRRRRNPLHLGPRRVGWSSSTCTCIIRPPNHPFLMTFHSKYNQKKKLASWAEQELGNRHSLMPYSGNDIIDLKYRHNSFIFILRE